MKTTRNISLLLAMSILFTLCTSSCGNVDGDTSSDTSESISESLYESRTESAKESISEKSDFTEDGISYVYADAAYIGESDGSFGRPYKTVEDAYAEAVRRLNCGDTSDVTVFLAPGEWRLSEEIYLDGSGLTAENAQIRIVGRQSGTEFLPTFSVSGDEFREISENIYRMYLPDEAKDENGEFPDFRDLYLNNEPLILARTEGEYLMAGDSANQAEQYGFDVNDRTLFVDRNALTDILTDENGYFYMMDIYGHRVYDEYYEPITSPVEICIKTEWQLHFLHAEGISDVPSRGLLDKDTLLPLPGVRINEEEWEIFKNGYAAGGTLKNCPYWFQNHIAFLDSEGEFYYDRVNGAIYIYSSRDITDSVVSYPVSERIINLKNITNLTLENLHFYHTGMNYVTENGLVCGQATTSKKIGKVSKERFLRFAAVYGEDLENVTVLDCTFTSLANDAVFFCGALDNITVSRCIFEKIGGGAVRIGQSVATFDETIHAKDILITENYMYDIARIYASSPAITVSSVLNLEISYNTVIECQYSAVSVGYDWTSRQDSDSAKFDSDDFVNVKNAHITHNYFKRYMLGLSDGGAVYTLGGNATRNQTEYLNSIDNNIAVLDPESFSHGYGTCFSYYHDGGSSHWGDYNNMIVIPESVGSNLRQLYYFQKSDNAPCYSSRIRGLYVIGYPLDHTASDKYPTDYSDLTNETIVGWYVILSPSSGSTERKAYTCTVDSVTGAYTMHGLKNDSHDNLTEEVYLYRSVNDGSMTEESRSFMEELYKTAGCNFIPRAAYGE